MSLLPQLHSRPLEVDDLKDDSEVKQEKFRFAPLLPLAMLRTMLLQVQHLSLQRCLFQQADCDLQPQHLYNFQKITDFGFIASTISALGSSLSYIPTPGQRQISSVLKTLKRLPRFKACCWHGFYSGFDDFSRERL